jgi:glycosyltransferase involved in cell wall biosynthesis
MEVTVIIPVYNEKDDIEAVIDVVKSVGIAQEIIVVDDLSVDGTRELLKTKKDIKTIFHDENMGKGAAIRSGLKNATGDIIIIQDADLEYSPEQYPQLVKPIKDGKTRVVYGSRILGKGDFLKSSYYANRFLTLMTNVLFNSHISDMETCYKVMKIELMRKLQLTSSRFEIEPEITCKILRRREKIVEIPITYTARRKGKKIGVKDGVQAIWNLIKWKFKK